jgi:hypothetical protein
MFQTPSLEKFSFAVPNLKYDFFLSLSFRIFFISKQHHYFLYYITSPSKDSSNLKIPNFNFTKQMFPEAGIIFGE